MANDVELLAEGTGPFVRTIGIAEPRGVDASGNAQTDRTRHQQVVTSADARGDLRDYSADILTELKAIHEAIVELNLRLT